MSKSVGQVVGGIIGATIGFIGGGPMGAVKGYMIGSSIGGMIDPPPGPDLKGPTLEDKSFNSAAYGVSLAILHGTIAHTGSIIYLENNEYKAVAKKQKTGGKGGGSKGSYTTTTYFATFAVAVAEAMPGSVIRRIWAGGKLIYSVGDTVSSDSLAQSELNAAGWHYYDGTQTEPDSRMEAVLGVGNCPSYEGTAYLMFYDFDLTEYGNGLQGCPIKVEISQEWEELAVAGDFFQFAVDSLLNCGQSYPAGVTITTGSPDDVLEISLISGAYTRNVSLGAWRTWVRVAKDFGVGFSDIGDDNNNASPEDAAAAFGGPYFLTGATNYTFYIYDGGLISDNDGTMLLGFPVYKSAVVSKKIFLVDILNRIFLSAGIDLGYTDFSELEEIEVTGYRISDVASARGKLGPLMVAYLFDLIEDGYTIKAVRRGGSSIATIPLSKCGARAAGESPGVLVRRDRETESQLPSRYSLTYIDYNREYDTNTQYADYPSRAVSERNQQLPIVLSANEAAQLVDVLINLAWAERFSYEFSWPQEYAYLKVSNVVTAEVAAGVWVVVSIRNITYTPDQRVQVSARRAEFAVYQSAAVGIEALPPSENIPRITDANTVIMDLPAITDDVTGYGFGVAMYGGQSWPGGNLLRSIDTGQTYDAIQAFVANCTVATATNSLAAGDYFVIDRTSELNITVVAGDFFSITEDQMLTGKHYCAYGVDGRWEIIQYAVSSVVSGPALKLSTFVRGLFGTEWAGDLHEAGDLVVLLDDPDTAFIGADAVALNSPRKFKGITNGQDAQLIDEIDFTYRGINLKPLSPVNVVGVLENEVWTISCSKRTRMASNQWATGLSAPSGETISMLEFDIYDGAVFKKTYQSASETFVYSSANQLADFGLLPTTITVKVYQLSATIGRGYPAERVLVGVADLYYAKTVLLLNMDAADNSTSFVDSSQYGAAITVVSPAKHAVASKIIGISSGLFNGSTSAIWVAHSAGRYELLGDFTIECFVRPAATISAVKQIVSKGSKSGVANPHWAVSALSTGVVFAQLGRSQATLSRNTITGTTVLASGQAYHIAFVRKGSTLRLFVGGVQEGGDVTVSITPLDSSAAGVWVGQFDGGTTSDCWNGLIDGVRVTKVARYWDTFAPPIEPFAVG